MEISTIHNLFLTCDSISIDTRNISQNSMFIAIKGDRFDANTFAEQALEKGAKYVIIDNESNYIDSRTIVVNNSLETLQELAKFHRKHLNIPIIALTGSNGKTTTKELIQVVLSKKFKTKATVGNLNNHIGVPLTLLSFTSETEIGIVEMGANHQKEIEFLCELATPNFGYITNFGKAHLEGFGGVEGVIKGKSEMYQYLEKSNSIAFINLEDPIQVEKTKKIKTYTFSNANTNANVKIDHITANPFVEISYNNNLIKSQLIGLYNANNLIAALSMGRYFDISEALIKEALEAYNPTNNRSQIITKGSNQIILDAYNANPSSMMVALQNFTQLSGTNKIMILGDMFELGDESLAEHHFIIHSELIDPSIKCYFVGKAFYENKITRDNFIFCNTYEDFEEHFKILPAPLDSLILIKGSRGMALERSLDLL